MSKFVISSKSRIAYSDFLAEASKYHPSSEIIREHIFSELIRESAKEHEFCPTILLKAGSITYRFISDHCLFIDILYVCYTSTISDEHTCKIVFSFLKKEYDIFRFSPFLSYIKDPIFMEYFENHSKHKNDDFGKILQSGFSALDILIMRGKNISAKNLLLVYLSEYGISTKTIIINHDKEAHNECEISKLQLALLCKNSEMVNFIETESDPYELDYTISAQTEAMWENIICSLSDELISSTI